MSNRDENLQKINAELEMMSDEELEQVAGGTVTETQEDTMILYDYGLMDCWYGSFGVTFDWLNKSKLVDEGWAKAGITCCTKFAKSNQYWHNGKEITRDEAIKFVKANFKKIHSASDFSY